MSTRTLLLCAALSLGACEEAFAPEQSGTSSLVFDYTGFNGQPSSAFVVEGEVPPDYGQGGLPAGDWAFAFRRGVSEPRLVVTAARSRADGRFDLLTLELPASVQPGQTLQLREGCGGPADCAYMLVYFGVERATNLPQTTCWVASGEGRVQASTARRVAGSFGGTATCTGQFTGQTLIQRGAFDVAVVAPT
jgi:hypothetical protein